MSMTEIGRPRFNVDALKEAAGDKVFARGAAYHAGGQVEIVAIDRERVVAKVVGSELYSVELTAIDGRPSGHCNCRAHMDWGFCKHMVATALAANALKPDEAAHASGRLGAIRDHLREQGVEALVEMVMSLAERDSALLRRLELAAAGRAMDDAAAVKFLKKALTDATSTRGVESYRGAGDWADGIAGVLDAIEPLIGQGRAGAALKLLDHFFDRMETALDDSDEGASVLERGAELHLAACKAAEPEPLALARDLFARETESHRDAFYDASGRYADLLGPAGLAEYRRLAQAAWDKLKPLRAGARKEAWSYDGHRVQLASILERFATAAGDLDALIAVRSKDLSTPHAYLRLAETCEAHGAPGKALDWVEEGLWQFEGEPDRALSAKAAALYREAGRDADAARILWRQFEKAPSLDGYRALKKTMGDAAAVAEMVERAVAVLRARPAATKPSWAWSHENDLLVDVLIEEGRLAEAWAASREPGCSSGRLRSLADASEAAFPDEALDAYAKLVEAAVQTTTAGGYVEACKMIARMGAVRARLGRSGEQASYVDALALKHKGKRNFVKQLQAVAAAEG